MGAAREMEINFSLRLILEAYAPHQLISNFQLLESDFLGRGIQSTKVGRR